MVLLDSVSHWLRKEAIGLSKESIIHRIRFIREYIFDDGVRVLQSNPLGMFFYNQRAIFFISGSIFLLILYLLERVNPGNRESQRIIKVLGGFLLIDVLVTLFLHRRFVRRL